MLGGAFTSRGYRGGDCCRCGLGARSTGGSGGRSWRILLCGRVRGLSCGKDLPGAFPCTIETVVDGEVAVREGKYRVEGI